MPDRRSTTAQLKDDIDSGRTGDKVRHFDPAAAALGTDDEAAGTPPSGAAVARERRQEGELGEEAETGARRQRVAWLLAFLLLLIILGAAFTMLGR